MREIDEISGDVLDLAIRVHKALGPGLLESVYEAVLAAELAEMGYHVSRQQPIDISFEGVRFEGAFRADLIVDGRLIVEIKSVERLTGAHAKQLLTYLRLTERSVGMLINFAGEPLREGVRRVVNNHSSSSAPPRLRVNQLLQPRSE